MKHLKIAVLVLLIVFAVFLGQSGLTLALTKPALKAVQSMARPIMPRQIPRPATPKTYNYPYTYPTPTPSPYTYPYPKPQPYQYPIFTPTPPPIKIIASYIYKFINPRNTHRVILPTYSQLIKK